MWVKTTNNQYVDLDNGTVLFASRYHDTVNSVADVERWRVQVESRNYAPKILAEGYADEAEAYAALEEFMSGEDFKELQPPVSDEESADTAADESTVDSEENK
jgi:hypothetical protein